MSESGYESPALSPDIPMARPVTLSYPEVHRPAPLFPTSGKPLTRLRAFVELLLLIPGAVLGGVLVYLVFWLYPVKDVRWFHLASSLALGLSLLSVVAIILRVDRHRGDSIGWTGARFGENVLVGLGTFVMSYGLAVATAVVVVALNPQLLDGPPAAQKAIEETFPPLPFALMVPIMLFVGVWEEVVFRGFLLTRLHALLRRWWLVLPAGALIFGVPHVYQGPLAMILIMGMAMIMGGLWLWKRSLVPCIVFHFANNVLMLALLRLISETWR